MGTFNYRAKKTGGEVVNGSLEAKNIDVVVNNLRDQGLFVIDISQPKQIEAGSRNINIGFLNRIRTRDIAIFTRQFSTLITSGMSLIESLVVLEKQTSNVKFTNIIKQVRLDVESGHSLSEAMGRHERVFNNLYISLVRAGESGGVLDETMDSLANFLEKEEDIRLKINNKTAYPKFVLVFCFIITMVIIVFLVPTFKGIYDELGAQLPLITRVVVSIGDLFKNPITYIVIIVLIIGGRYIFRKYRKTPAGRLMVDRIRIGLPKIGDILKKIALSRFSRHLGTLMRAGVPIISAFDIVKGVANNVLIDNAIEDIKNNIRKGENVSGPMSRHEVFPPMMVQMTAIGERTGTLDTNLIKVSDFYDSEVSNSIDIMVTILEPAMLLVVALLVGTIVIAMYLPMFNIYQYM